MPHRPLARFDSKVDARGAGHAGSSPAVPSRGLNVPGHPVCRGDNTGNNLEAEQEEMEVWKGSRLRGPVRTSCPCLQAPVHTYLGRCVCRTRTASSRPGPRTPPGVPCTEAPGPHPGSPAPRGHWAVSGHVCGCHTGGQARDAARHPAVPRTAPQRTTAGQRQQRPRGPCSDLCGNMHTAWTAHAGCWGARARAGVCVHVSPPAGTGAPGPQQGRPREGPEGAALALEPHWAFPALRVSVTFWWGRGGHERRHAPAAEWHLVTVTSPFVCRLNRSLGDYI